jgi:hypothetical protein
MHLKDIFDTQRGTVGPKPGSCPFLRKARIPDLLLFSRSPQPRGVSRLFGNFDLP